jgi:serine/threonine protein kinase
VLVGLSHPNICAYLGAVARFPPHKDMEVGMVFERRRTNLHRALHNSSSSPLPLNTRLQILQDIAAGLTYLHTLNIIHRDLSSRNILLDDDNRGSITDFGCSRRLHSHAEYNSSTISGSPPYMPLEQLTGLPLTLKVDVFAFGTLIWETWSLLEPHAEHGNDIYKITALAQGGSRLPLLPSTDPHSKLLDFRIGSLIRRSTNPYPKARPHMHEMEAMLQHVLSNAWHETEWEIGRANLEKRLEKLYTVRNPTKIPDALSVSEEWYGNEMELNRMIQQRYNCELPELAEQPVTQSQATSGARTSSTFGIA